MSFNLAGSCHPERRGRRHPRGIRTPPPAVQESLPGYAIGRSYYREADVARGGISGVVSKAKQSVGLESPAAAEAEGAVRTVRDALRSIGDGDWDGFVRVLKEDVSWQAPGGDFPGGGGLSGRDEVKDKFFGTIERTYASFGFMPESFVDAPDDEVVVFGSFECESRKGNTRVNEPGVILWKLDGDEATEVRIYTDSDPFPEPLSEDDERELEGEIKDEEQEKQRKQSEDDESEPRSESEDQSRSEGEDETGSDGDEGSRSEESEGSRAS
jgi:ketosteroid isomerase-like protein